MGVPGQAYSLSGAFTSMGKITVIVIFLMGKNRALPELNDPVISFKYPELESALEMRPPLGMPPYSTSMDPLASPTGDLRPFTSGLEVIREGDEEEEANRGENSSLTVDSLFFERGQGEFV